MIDKKQLIEELLDCVIDATDTETQITGLSMCAMLMNEVIDEALILTDVVNCNCDESKQLEEEFEINHLINDTYQVVGKDSSTVWKQGTMEECNDWVML